MGVMRFKHNFGTDPFVGATWEAYMAYCGSVCVVGSCQYIHLLGVAKW